jgi:hypothetical protein
MKRLGTAHVATAPADPIPPATAHEPAQWCRGLGTHAWHPVPPMFVVAGGNIQVRLHCHRCGSARVDRWAPRTGAVDGRSYTYTDAYTDVLENTRGDTRKEMISAGRPRPISAHVQATQKKGAKNGNGNGGPLRLVSKRKSRVRARSH